MAAYKVFIPCAGMGTRMQERCNGRNKALISLGNRPAISYIIDNIEKGVDVVVALGYQGADVRDFLNLAYTDRTFEFVSIDDYNKPSGSLHSTLLQCSPHLQVPFVFCSNDTITTDEIPRPDHNWLGTSNATSNQYRTVELSESKVLEIEEKGYAEQVYIGLAGIRDYVIFWDSMKRGSCQEGEVLGVKGLLPVEAKDFTWIDTGNMAAFMRAEEWYTDDQYSILPKAGEDIWFVNEKVIKWSSNSEFINKRVLRAEHLGGWVPEIEGSREHMYVYEKVKGDTFSKKYSLKSFKSFLKEMTKFWEHSILDEEAKIEFRKKCLSFYKDKTEERVNKYFEKEHRVLGKDQAEVINGVQVDSLEKMLGKVPWQVLSEGVPVRFHGDLHFENIIVGVDESFTLIDWRQDFAGEMQYGDIYYDFAKLHHGMIINHELINAEEYSFIFDEDGVSFDFLQKYSLCEAAKELEKYVKGEGYDWLKVKLLTALIFLNIAPLHHDPYSKVLFYLGKSLLQESVGGGG